MSNLLEKASILLTPTAYDDGKILSVKPEEVLGSELMPSIATIANLGGGSITQITENIYSSTSDGTSGSAVRPKFDFNTTAGKTYKLVITPIGTITGTINFDFYDGSTYLFQDYDFTTIKEITFTDNGTVFGAFNGQLAYSISNFKVSIKEEIDGDFDFTRNSSATRVNSQGLIEDVQILSSNLVSNGDFSQEGSEEITNGDFSNGSTDWILTPSSGTAIVSDGKLNFTNSSSGGTQVSQRDRSYVIGKTYEVTYTVTDYIQGNVRLSLGNNLTTSVSANGTFTQYITYASGLNRTYIYTSGSTLSIDNVSVKEVGQDWTLGTGWSIGVGKVIGSSASGTLSQAGITSAGKQYKVTFSVTDYSSGTLYVDIGSSSAQTTTSNGLKTFYFTSTSTGSLRFYGGSFTGSIDNVSVIEITDDTNLPRIDYSPYSGAGTCGHWLFEPQSTNLLTYSEDLTQGSLNRLLLTSNTNSSPDGTNTADKLIPNNTTSTYHYFAFSSLTIATNNVYSVFLKKAEYEYALISFETSGSSGSSDKALINLNNGTIEQSDTETKVEDFGNGWYRCSIKATSARTSVVIYPLPSTSLGSFTGDNTSGIFAWGLQLEQQSYPTSYIPTNGSTVTRLKDAAFGAGNSSLINSTEGVLYVEVAALAEQTLTRYITLSNGASSNRIIIYITDVGVIKFFVGVGGVTQAAKTVSGQTTTNFNKLAVSYKENDIKFYLNGVKVHTDTSASTFPADTLNVLNFAASNGTSSPFFGKANCLAVFKEALTDAELTCLTTI